MATIPILQPTTFVTYDPRNFQFIGSIPEEILVKVPKDNVIVTKYRKLPLSGVCLILDDLQTLLD